MLLKLQKLAEIMVKWALELPFAETYQKIRYIAIELPTKSSHGNDLDSDSSIRTGFSRQLTKRKPISRQLSKRKSLLADNLQKESTSADRKHFPTR